MFLSSSRGVYTFLMLKLSVKINLLVSDQVSTGPDNLMRNHQSNLTNFFAFVSVLAVDRHPNLASSSFPFFLLQISWTTQMHMILKSLYTCFKLSKMSLQLSYGLSKTYDNSLFHEFFCLSSEHSCNTFTKHQYSYRTQLDDTTD